MIKKILLLFCIAYQLHAPLAHDPRYLASRAFGLKKLRVRHDQKRMLEQLFCLIHETSDYQHAIAAQKAVILLDH